MQIHTIIKMSGGFEDQTIEELNQKLEELGKDNETIRRENKLYESFITRNQKNEPAENDEESKDNQKNLKIVNEASQSLRRSKL
jgi:hypothetical protein